MRRLTVWMTRTVPWIVLISGFSSIWIGYFAENGDVFDRLIGGILLLFWTIDARLSRIETIQGIMVSALRDLVRAELSKKHPACIFYANNEQDEDVKRDQV